MLNYDAIRLSLSGYLDMGFEVSSLAPLTQPDVRTMNYQGVNALDDLRSFEGRNVALRMPNGRGFALKVTLDAWQPTFDDNPTYHRLVGYQTFRAFVGRTVYFDFKHDGRIRCVGDGRVRDGGFLHGVEVVSHGHVASGIVWSENNLGTLQVIHVGSVVADLADADEIRDALIKAGALE